MFKKSFLSIALCLFAMLQMTAKPHNETIDGFNYFINTDAKEATLLKGDYSGDVKIPSSVTAADGVVCNVVALGDECFKGTNITSVEIPNTVTELGDYCFYQLYNITSIELPSSVTELGEGCFFGCGLTSVEIPSSVKLLRDWCFYGCTSLTNINIPSSVTSLGDACFQYCNFESIKIPSSVTSLGKRCFYECKKLVNIELSSSLKSLGEECFFGCSSLANIEIPSSVTVTKFSDYCFEGCTSLVSIRIPSSVTSLGTACFSDCSSLTSIKIPSSVASLGMGCFSDCSSLTSIELPSSLGALGENCFYDCSSLIEIKCFAEKVPSTSGTFDGLSTSTCLLSVPKQSLDAYKADAEWGQFRYIYALDESETGTGSEKCEKPEISFANGALDFKSSTPGAEYHYTIADDDIKTDAYDDDGHVELAAAYDITAYATADGYQPSDRATAKLLWLDGNLDNTSSNINPVAKRGIVAKAEGGIVSISGLKDGERVTFSSVDGKILGSATSANGTAGFSTPEKIVLVKIGSQSVKLVME